MQFFLRSLIRRQTLTLTASNISPFKTTSTIATTYLSAATDTSNRGLSSSFSSSSSSSAPNSSLKIFGSENNSSCRWAEFGSLFAVRRMATEAAAEPEIAPRIKFKRLDKTAGHIMQILDKEAVEEVKAAREIPDIRPGYIVQLKVEVPDNKRRVSIIKGIVIARRNAGLNTTFRVRRLVAGVGVESVFPLYSPNIKEIKVLDKKKVRRAKLYYLRDKMNPLKK